MKPARINRKAPYEQVKEAIYKKYIAHSPEAGTRLPSDRALAAEFNVNVATVAKGLTSLSMEGVLTRRVGSGTFIQQARIQTTKTTGIYIGAAATSYAHPEMAFFAKLDQLLQQTLHSRDSDFIHYADSRIREYWSIPHPALENDSRDGKLSDLIVVRANPSNYAWIDQLAANVISFEVDYGGSIVYIDYDAFSRQSVEYLARSGCRSVGLITRVPQKASSRSAERPSLHASFHSTAQKEGLEVNPDWIKTDDFDNTLYDVEPMDSEIFGHTAFQSLWNSPNRPEGLVIHSDIIGLGVIRAARDLGVDLNRDIKTVFSANIGNTWPALEQFTRMAFPIKEIASALISLVGKDKERIHIKPVLVTPR